MRVDRGRLNWGIFFIVVGSVAVAYHEGAVSSSVLLDAWRLWPLVLVGIGLKFIFSRTRVAFAGGLVVAITLGLMFGSFFAVGPNVGCGGIGHGTSRSTTQSGAFEGDSTVNLNLQCGTATITTSADNQWHVTSVNSNGSVAGLTSSTTSLRVESAGPSGWFFDRGVDDVQIALPQDTRISLNSELDMGEASFNLTSANLTSARFNLNLGSLHVNLAGARVGNLSVETNLGSVWVALDSSSDVTGELKTNLGSLEVCVHPDLGVRVSASDSLSSSEFRDLDMVRNGNTWTSRNYETATHHANLTVSTNLGSFKLRNAGGCK